MNREIKFRAWNKPTKQMFYWPNLQEMLAYPNMVYHDRRNFEPEYNEWMQFTGLKDKNGKEIYEGDIVKTADDGELIVELRKCVFGVETLREQCFGENGYENVEEFLSLDDYSINTKCTETGENYILEVIGNIYENENLLE